MAKYNEKLVSRIERLIEADLYTISEICTAMKISRNTFYYWKEKNPDFRRRVDEAEERRDDELVKIARSSLKKKLTGYTTIEEHCTYQPAVSNPSVMILKKKVVKTKQKDPRPEGDKLCAGTGRKTQRKGKTGKAEATAANYLCAQPA